MAPGLFVHIWLVFSIIFKGRWSARTHSSSNMLSIRQTKVINAPQKREQDYQPLFGFPPHDT